MNINNSYGLRSRNIKIEIYYVIELEFYKVIELEKGNNNKIEFFCFKEEKNYFETSNAR